MNKHQIIGKYRVHIAVAMFGLGVLTIAVAIENRGARKHDFEGKCQLCHVGIPEAGTPFEEIQFKDAPDQMCAQCHEMDKKTSHPSGVQPSKEIPLKWFLDEQGRMTCLTCHDVHKEERYSQEKGLTDGLLRGHTTGRGFCLTCHDQESLGAGWRHDLVISYAHMTGKLTQSKSGDLLDSYSVECLSCHDGVISKMDAFVVRSGEYEHSIGLSHPVGVQYPKNSAKNDYASMGSLPDEVKLFDGKVGCLTCHNPYGGNKASLSMDNTGSALCYACHNK